MEWRMDKMGKNYWMFGMYFAIVGVAHPVNVWDLTISALLLMALLNFTAARLASGK
mgnify:CR=1 FL=1